MTEEQTDLRTIDPEVYKELDRSKMDLMLEGGTFLTSVGLMLKHKFTYDVPTAATNGTEIMYNPDFFMGMTPQERVGVMAHEIMHVALMHMLRLGHRDPKVHNMAADYVINDMLRNSGHTLPEPHLYDRKYHGMTTEEVYGELMDEGAGERPNVIGMDLHDPTDGAEDPAQAEADVKAKVQDIVIKAQTQAQLDGDAGSVPGEISRAINDLINPKLNWKQLLQRFVDSTVKEDYSWSRPNRRYLPDYYLPSQFSEGIDNITVAVDTSGSVSQVELIEMMSEVKEIHDLYKPKKMTVLDCDWAIHGIHEVTEDSDPTTIQFQGGGGTSFIPVLDYCKENETNVLLYFTDLYAESITKEYAAEKGYNFPTMWICYSQHHAPEWGETVYYEPECHR